MQKITRDTILALLNQETAYPSVTIYMPTHRATASPNITEDTIRFKNLINKAADIIKAEASGKPESKKVAEQLCSQLEETVDDMVFWENQTEGLMICAKPGMLEMYNLPMDTDEYVGVDSQFHLAPILGMLHDSQSYYVLALAQHNPVMYKGDDYGLEVMDIGLPKSVNASLNIDEANARTEQQRSASGGSLNTAQFNGRGGAKDPRENDRMQFFHKIDDLLQDRLDKSLPLVVAGIEAEVVEFKSISKYPHLLEHAVFGNYTSDRLRPELFERAFALIREHVIGTRRRQALEQYQQLQGMARTAGDEQEILEAADQGRVDTLFVRMIRHTRDTIRDNMGVVARITFPEQAVAKKLNDLAMRVWRTSGKVICLDDSQLPTGSPAIATLRY